MSFENIKPGMTLQHDLTVEENQTVSHTGSAILSTPMMISLMEQASAELVRPLLPPDFTTVGFEVHVRHKAAARLGSSIRVQSRVLEADGRKLLFEVLVTEGNRIIGEGRHRRTVIPIAERGSKGGS